MKKNLLSLVIALFIPIIGWAEEQGYAVFDSETGTLTFKYGEKPVGDNVYDTDNTKFNPNNPTPWVSYGLKKVVFDPSFANARPKSTEFWFSDARYLTEIVDIKYLNTSNVTNMRWMFEMCIYLTSLDVSNFDTGNVTDMSVMFNGCVRLTSLDVSNFDTSNVTNMYAMFTDCDGLTSLDVSHFDTSNVTNMSWMFLHCAGLTSLDVSSFNTSKVTDMSQMFSRCTGLTSLDVSNFNTSKVTDMSQMFYDCDGLTSLDLSHFDTGYVTNMESMFQSCELLRELDLSSFDTGKVTDMSCMFDGCNSLTSLDLSHFDTRNVTDMPCMFRSCGSLTSLDLSHFDTGNVTNMESMFQSCELLRELDLSSFDTGRVTDMWSMFGSCYILESVYVSDKWTTANVTSGDGVFYRCERLVGGMGTAVLAVYEPGQMDYTYARIDGGPDAPGYLTDIADRVDREFAVFDSEAGTLTFMYGKMPGGLNVFHADNIRFNPNEPYNPEYWDCEQIKKVIFDPSFANARPKSTAFWFYRAYLLSDIVGIEYLNTSEVTDMSHMFDNCGSLTSLDLSTFDTGNVTDMEKMFYDCYNLETIYASDKWSIANVTEGEYTFESCRKLLGGMGTAYAYDKKDYTFARIDGGEEAPGYFTKKLADGETVPVKISQYGKTTFCSNYNLDFSRSEAKAYVATGYEYQGESSIIWMTRVKDVPAGTPIVVKGTANATYPIPVKSSSSSYYKNLLVRGAGLPVYDFDGYGNRNYVMSGGKFVAVGETPSAAIGTNKCYLQLPETMNPTVAGAAQSLTLSATGTGKTTYCAPVDLDLTDVEGLIAYSATGYDNSTGTIWLTRVNKVSAGEGLLLKGTKGGSYTIPSVGIQSYYANMIVGNNGTADITINPTDDEFTNYVLSGGKFVALGASTNIPVGKAYLQIPSVALTRAADAAMPEFYDLSEEPEVISMVVSTRGIGSDNNTTGIEAIDNGKWKIEDNAYYNLNGQRVEKPSKGLYIKNGNKVVVK